MIDNLIIAAYLVIVLVYGFYKSRNITTMRQFSIAEQNYSLPIMVATVTATAIGGGATFGITSSVFTEGVVYILIAFGNPLNLLLVSQFFVDKIDGLNDCISVGDIMEKFYGKPARIIAGLCGGFYSAAAIGGQVTAIGFIVNYFLGWPFIIGVLIGCGALVIYSTFGGIKAVTATDLLQFAVLIIAVPMVCNIGLNLVGGYNALFERIPPHLLELPSTPSSAINYFFIFLAFAVPFLDPPTMQRVLMARDRAQIRSTFRISALIEVVFFVVIGLIGLIAIATNPDQEANFAFPHLVNTIVPIGLKGFAVAGLLSVVMSTADSYLNAASITLVHDAIKPMLKTEISDKTELRLTQAVTLFIGAGAMIISLSFSGVMSIILFSLNFWGPIIVVPLYAGLLGYKVKRSSFYSGITTGCFVFLLWHFMIEPSLGISSLIPSMLGNALGFIAAQCWPQKTSNLKHDKLVANYGDS